MFVLGSLTRVLVGEVTGLRGTPVELLIGRRVPLGGALMGKGLDFFATAGDAREVNLGCMDLEVGGVGLVVSELTVDTRADADTALAEFVDEIPLRTRVGRVMTLD